MGSRRIGQARLAALVSGNDNGARHKLIRQKAVSAAVKLKASDSGSTIIWTMGTAHAITLPPAEPGLNFKIIIKVGSDNAHTIEVASGVADCFFGSVTVYENNTDAEEDAHQIVTYAESAESNPGNFDTLLIDGNATATGGCAGDVIFLEGITKALADESFAGTWLVKAKLGTTGTPASIATIYAG